MIQNPHILLFVAKDQFSDTEFNTIKSFLIQKRVKFSIVSDTNNYCRSDKNKLLVPDIKNYNLNINNFDALILVGGSGIHDYFENSFLKNLVISFKGSKKILAAICNAPLLFDRYKILQNQEITCYHQNKHLIVNNIFSNKSLIRKDNIVMAQSPNDILEMMKLLLNILKGN